MPQITSQKSAETRFDVYRARASRFFSEVFTVFNVGLALLIISLSVGAIGYWQVHDGFTWQNFWQDYYANISAEFGSVAITVLIIDSLNQRRQREEEKQRLLRQMGSKENGLALQAVEELRALGALKDGTLRAANLEEANLEDVRLGRVDMRQARMDFSNLKKAHLFFANMENADMSGVDLSGAVLTGANLSGTDLVAADLRGALLSEVDLAYAKLEQAKFNEQTQLPDKSYWSHGADLDRFTNPQHPQFWRSEMQESPAYVGRYGK
ncbi:MAG: pentapeptide repeat-containing protein [Chloroflexota bacterium]